MDIEIIRQDWRKRGFSCDLWVDPPGQRWDGYVHGTDELVMVVEGEIEFEVAGVIHHPSTGQEVFILAGAVHSVGNVGKTEARWLYGYRENYQKKLTQSNGPTLQFTSQASLWSTRHRRLVDDNEESAFTDHNP